MNFVTLINFRLLDQIKRPYEDLVDACFSGAAQSWPLETFYFEEELESFRQLLINDTGYFTFLSRNTVFGKTIVIFSSEPWSYLTEGAEFWLNGLEPELAEKSGLVKVSAGKPDWVQVNGFFCYLRSMRM